MKEITILILISFIGIRSWAQSNIKFVDSSKLEIVEKSCCDDLKKYIGFKDYKLDSVWFDDFDKKTIKTEDLNEPNRLHKFVKQKVSANSRSYFSVEQITPSRIVIYEQLNTSLPRSKKYYFSTRTNKK
jgi:hypothetical protein